MATARYLVNDVGAAVDFYTGALGFETRQRFGPAMAIVTRGDLDLWLAGDSRSPGDGTASSSTSPTCPPWSR
jgi:catechol 2,3-dioxygenase-like lactoylglutathione lyase family enzyme